MIQIQLRCVSPSLTGCPEKDPSQPGNDRPGQLHNMPTDVYGHHTLKHEGCKKGHTSVSRLQEQVPEGGCSEDCLVKHWSYGDQKTILSNPKMLEGGSASSVCSSVESCSGGIMTAGGLNSDFYTTDRG